MNYPTCALRKCIDEVRGLHFCTHPRVHTPDGLIQQSFCQSCTLQFEPRPLVCRTTPDRFLDESRLVPPLSKVAVVIPCHNYGRFLAEALESVLAQTVRAAEVVVVDDNSTDNTAEVARRFQHLDVRLIRIASGNVNQARRTGFESTISPVLCFLDADDLLPADYLECGLLKFRSMRNVAIVHSNLQCFGRNDSRIVFPEVVDRSMLSANNQIHAGSLVRRDALVLSGAFDEIPEPAVSNVTGDWWIWKKILGQGWKSVRQDSDYLYRRHTDSSLAQSSLRSDFYRVSHLQHEEITLFLPLSGRLDLWQSMSEFLESQCWPHEQVRLVLMDTSQNDTFFARVRQWIGQCDYPDVRHFRRQVGVPGLADKPRAESVSAVRRSMARIYNELARSVTTPFVWILEDDVFPEPGICEQLIRGFDTRTASVSAPYRSRFHNGYVAWDHFHRTIQRKGTGLESIGGNGFGCVILRSEVLSQHVFSASDPNPDFDHEFYARLRVSGLTAKIHWDCEAEHRCQSNRHEEHLTKAMEAVS